MAGTRYGTGFVESEVLLAALNNDSRTVDQHLAQMTESEALELRRACREVIDAIENR